MNKTGKVNHAKVRNLKFNKASLAALIVAVLGVSLGLLGRIIKGGYGDVGLLVDFVGFILGVAVFLKITFSKIKQTGRLLAFAAIILSVVGVMVVGGDLGGRDGDFGFHRCRTRLLGLAISLDFYRSGFNGKNPSDLNILMQHEDVTLRMLTCPDTKIYEDRYKDTHFWYVYRGNDLDDTSPDGLIMLHDRLGTHSDGRNVLFYMADKPLSEFIQMDEMVKWQTEDEFQEAIKQDNELRRQIGLPEKDINGNAITQR